MSSGLSDPRALANKAQGFEDVHRNNHPSSRGLRNFMVQNPWEEHEEIILRLNL
jgi:hypothetical protein